LLEEVFAFLLTRYIMIGLKISIEMKTKTMKSSDGSETSKGLRKFGNA